MSENEKEDALPPNTKVVEIDGLKLVTEGNIGVIDHNDYWKINDPVDELKGVIAEVIEEVMERVLIEFFMEGTNNPGPNNFPGIINKVKEMERREQSARRLFEYLQELWDGDIQDSEIQYIYDWLAGKGYDNVTDGNIEAIATEYELDMV